MARRIVAAIVATITLHLFHCTATAAPPEAPMLTVGIVPQQAAGALAKIWVPALDFLGKQTGYTLRFATAKDIPSFEQRLASGEYDIAYMNPYHYVVFHRAPGYRVFAKEKDTRLAGIIVVRKQDSYSTLSQLRGKTVAFPGPISFAATLLPQAEFRKLGVAIESQYVASHDSVYMAVAHGLFVAGGGIPRTFEKLNPELRDQLRILWQTVGYTPHAFAAHPRVPDEVLARLSVAMKKMQADTEGAPLLQALGFKGFVSAEDNEYDDIRRMEIATPGHPANR